MRNLKAFVEMKKSKTTQLIHLVALMFVQRTFFSVRASHIAWEFCFVQLHKFSTDSKKADRENATAEGTQRCSPKKLFREKSRLEFLHF